MDNPEISAAPVRARARRAGFTLIELMIVVAIIAILAVVAIPKFTGLIIKSREGATKGNLATLRSSLHIYYGDTDGFYPTDDLACLTANAKYLSAMPVVRVPSNHDESARVDNNDDLGMGTMLTADSGVWLYWNWSASSLAPREWGDLWIGCTHTTAKGENWTDL